MLTSCKLTGSAAKIAAYHSSEENYYFSQAAGVESLAGGAAAGGPQIHGALAAALGFNDGSAITERVTLTFRAEFMNATNSPQFFNGPIQDVNSGNFGRISGALDQSNLPRFIQLSLKLQF